MNPENKTLKLEPAAANEVVRILEGHRQKYTVRIHKPDGKIVEYQSENTPKLDWNSEARQLWIAEGGYGETAPIMPYEPGMIIRCEKNPDAPAS